MRVKTNSKASPDTDATSTFNIQVCTPDGQLVTEYTLHQQKDKVATLKAAESFARKRLMECMFEPLILVVSEETLTKYRQVQVRVSVDSHQAAKNSDRIKRRWLSAQAIPAKCRTSKP